MSGLSEWSVRSLMWCFKDCKIHLFVHIVGALCRKWAVCHQHHWRIERGAYPAHAPQRGQILSFWHTTFLKRNRLGNPRRPMRSTPPPTGNPDSATEHRMQKYKNWIAHFCGELQYTIGVYVRFRYVRWRLLLEPKITMCHRVMRWKSSYQIV